MRVYLAAIVLVALVPALGVGATGAWLAMESYRRASEDRLHDTARSVELALNREIERSTTGLSYLAGTPLLDAGLESDLRDFYTHARRAAEAVGAPVGLVGPDLLIRLDTDRPYGAALPATVAIEATRQAFESGRPTVSNLLLGAISGRQTVVLNVPVLRGGRAVAVLGTRIEPGRLSALLATAELSNGAIAALMDGNRVIMARSQAAARFFGTTPPPWFAEAVDRQATGLAQGETADGREVQLAFRHIAGTPGWTLAVLEPIAVYNARWRSPVMTLVLGGSATLALALLFALWLGRRVLKPIAQLTQQAEDAVSGAGAWAFAAAGGLPRFPKVAEFEALREVIGRAGAAVRSSERRLRALAEDGATALWRATPDREIIESRGWEVMTGMSREALSGSGWLQALHPDDRAATEAAWRRAAEERRPVDVEYRVRYPGGRWVWHKARGLPLLDADGAIEEWVGAVINIEDRKTAEAAFSAGESRMRSLVDTAPDAIVVMDIHGMIQSFNQGAERIFGYAAAEVIGRSVSMLMPADLAKLHEAGVGRYLRTGEARAIGSVTPLQGLRKNGAIVPLDANIGEWRDATGALFFTGVMRDVTERRQAEEKQNLLVREVDHRAKNVLTVVQSVLRLTPATDVRQFAADVESRVAALARAHSLLALGGWTDADFRVVAAKEVAAHLRQHQQQELITLEGPAFQLSPTAVQPVAMVLHELATNAVKHGSLSQRTGRVTLGWQVDAVAGQLLVTWAESCGPAVVEPSRRGFGSRMIEATVRSQLGGSLSWDWNPEGLVCRVSLPLTRIGSG